MKSGVYKRLIDNAMFRAIGAVWHRHEQFVALFPQHSSTGLIAVEMGEFEREFEFITSG